MAIPGVETVVGSLVVLAALIACQRCLSETGRFRLISALRLTSDTKAPESRG